MSDLATILNKLNK